MINFNYLRDYCNSFDFVEESFPFDEKTLVFKCGGKMFVLVDIDDFKNINLKCDPEYAIELRSLYSAISPGYHMNKKHWNTIEINSDVPTKLIFELIKHSYNLVFNSLPKKIKNQLNSNNV